MLPERLIVAADFKPTTTEECIQVRKQVLELADKLAGTGVYLKVNSALRFLGYRLISEIHARGLKVFADLKLNDIGETLSTDGTFLRVAEVELLTVMCTAGVAPMKALKDQLPNTEVLGVTILTSLNSVDVGEMFCCSVEDSVIRLAGIAKRAGIDGLISSPKEAEKLRAEFGDFFSINTPAIRPSWAIIPGDDQNPERIMTPAKAIKAGADRIVVGRPILQAKEPLEAVYRTLEEIWMVVGS